jgi:hypothetical protein
LVKLSYKSLIYEAYFEQNNKNLALFCLVICLLSFQQAMAEESWQRSNPGDAKIGNKISLKQEHVEMHVPSSLNGREVKDSKTVFMPRSRK